MTSLVERLRSYVQASESEAMGMSPCGLCENAATTIERLMAEVERLKAAHEQEIITAFIDGFINDYGFGTSQVDEAIARFQAQRKGGSA